MAQKGITRRWLTNGLSLIVLLLALICFLGGLGIRFYYYQQTQQALYTRADALAAQMNRLSENATFDFEASSRSFVESFADKEMMELQMLNAHGEVMMSSTGFTPDNAAVQPDYREARLSEQGWDAWYGTSTEGERVMAVSVVVHHTGGVCGAVRCVTSLSQVNRQVGLLTGMVVVVCLVILAFVVLASTYFLRSIVHPTMEISSAARRMALGDYGFRVKKWHDDELGDLSDTVNYMAGQLQTTERLKNEFIASVSHELRTPLTAIKGWSETLKQCTPEDRELMDKGLAVISQESERLSSLVEELLDFSRMQNGTMTIKATRLDVQAELEDAVFLFRERAQQENIRLQFVENDGVPSVRGDRDRLRQVFVNLLDNALKYSDPGDKVRVEAAAVGQRVQIVISDTGRGIAKEDLKKVTQKFYKADKTRPGSGIGLSLVDEIVRRHGGQLEIDSKKGVGTTVTVTLPQA